MCATRISFWAGEWTQFGLYRIFNFQMEQYEALENDDEPQCVYIYVQPCAVGSERTQCCVTTLAKEK